MNLQTASKSAVRSRSRLHPVLRWLPTFAGFPLGGFAAQLLVGPVNGPVAAAAGGLITGLVLGAVQYLGLGGRRPDPVRWIVGTGIGLAIGLLAGAAAVDHRTTLGALVVQGALSGLAVGAAQAVALWPQLGRRAMLWPAMVAASWAAGWAVTTAIGVQVESQFTVFGSAGAIVVAALTSVLPIALQRAEERAR